MEILSQAMINPLEKTNFSDDVKLNKINQSAEKVAQSFEKFFNQALNNVQQLENQSNDLTNKLATGEINDLHQVMIAAEKANISLQFVIQVRNKAVEAYQEVMRMQV